MISNLNRTQIGFNLFSNLFTKYQQYTLYPIENIILCNLYLYIHVKLRIYCITVYFVCTLFQQSPAPYSWKSVWEVKVVDCKRWSHEKMYFINLIIQFSFLFRSIGFIEYQQCYSMGVMRSKVDSYQSRTNNFKLLWDTTPCINLAPSRH